MKYNVQEKLPIMFWLLSQNKYVQLIKIMLHQQLSQKMLQQYGSDLVHKNLFKNEQLMKSIIKFSFYQLIEMKGSKKQKPKNYQNLFLVQLLSKKLQTTLPTHKQKYRIWTQFIHLHESDNLYSNLAALETPTEFLQIINKDIHRTSTTPIFKQQATEILKRFANYNPFIGYCQGLNYIVVFMLQNGLSKQQSFYLLKRLTEVVIPTDYYTSMSTPLSDVKIVFQMLAILKPEIFKKLKQYMKQIDGSHIVVLSFVFQWFLCLYTNNFNSELAKIIWTHLILEGNIVLFKAAIITFQFIQAQIMSTSSFDKYIKIVETAVKNITDVKLFNEKLINFYISQRVVNLIRYSLQRHKNIQMVKFNKINTISAEKKTKKFKQKKKCRRNWNACMQQIQNQIDNGTKEQFFIFKKSGKVNIIDNYLETLSKRYFDKKKSFINPLQTMMIGRMEHICQASLQSITEDSIGQRQHSTKSKIFSPQNVKQEEKVRTKFTKKIEKLYQKEKQGMKRSQSIVFMKMMVENTSLTNLLELYDSEGVYFEN